MLSRQRMVNYCGMHMAMFGPWGVSRIVTKEQCDVCKNNEEIEAE